MLMRSRIVAAFCILILVTITLLVSIYANSRRTLVQFATQREPANSTASLDSCPDNLNRLTNLSITFPIRHSRRDIIVNPVRGLERASVTKVDGTLFPKPQVVDLLENPESSFQQCLEPLKLDVPVFPEKPVDASHIVFGLSTSLERLETSIVFIQRWLAHTEARLFIIATGPDDRPPENEKAEQMQSRMEDLGMAVKIVKPLQEGDNMPERYFSLLKLLYNQRDSKTQWAALIDDDTFFPSMNSLVAMVENYDAKERWYLGGLSEEWWSVVRYGLMGFGGAGVFLSLPMLALLDKHYQDCKDRSDNGGGDFRIMECIYWHSHTKLTPVSGLHQLDLHGDRSGLFESGRLMLSLHHWKEGWWDVDGFGPWFPMRAMHLVADVCGDCFLQRWQFSTDTILSNGYSIAIYPTGALQNFDKTMDLEKMENTWLPPKEVEGSNNQGFAHDLGPLRPMLKLEEEKIQYRFLDAVAEDGGVRQFYLHKGVEGDIDSLIELFWRRRGG